MLFFFILLSQLWIVPSINLFFTVLIYNILQALSVEVSSNFLYVLYISNVQVVNKSVNCLVKLYIFCVSFVISLWILWEIKIHVSVLRWYLYLVIFWKIMFQSWNRCNLYYNCVFSYWYSAFLKFAFFFYIKERTIVLRFVLLRKKPKFQISDGV